MEKVKIFSSNDTGHLINTNSTVTLEDAMNEFLSANPDITIKRVLQSMRSSNGGLTLTIFYEEVDKKISDMIDQLASFTNTKRVCK